MMMMMMMMMDVPFTPRGNQVDHTKDYWQQGADLGKWQVKNLMLAAFRGWCFTLSTANLSKKTHHCVGHLELQTWRYREYHCKIMCFKATPSILWSYENIAATVIMFDANQKNGTSLCSLPSPNNFSLFKKVALKWQTSSKTCFQPSNKNRTNINIQHHIKTHASHVSFFSLRRWHLAFFP